MEKLIAEYAQSGLGYLISVIAGIVILWLFRRLDAKDKVIENRDTVIQTLQEKRVTENADRVENLVVVSRDMISAMKDLKDAVGSIKLFIENNVWKKQ